MDADCIQFHRLSMHWKLYERVPARYVLWTTIPRPQDLISDLIPGRSAGQRRRSSRSREEVRVAASRSENSAEGRHA